MTNIICNEVQQLEKFSLLIKCKIDNWFQNSQENTFQTIVQVTFIKEASQAYIKSPENRICESKQLYNHIVV